MSYKGSHSFTCHQTRAIPAFTPPAAEHHRPLAGTHCAYPRRDGQTELTWVETRNISEGKQLYTLQRDITDL